MSSLSTEPSEYTPLVILSSALEAARTPETRKEKVGAFLESRKVHLLVISLIALDAFFVLSDLSYTFLTDSCSSPTEPDESEPLWLTIFSLCSTFITFLFLVEIPASVYAFGAGYFNPFGRIPHSSLHLLDALVIMTTFILEVVLKGREQELGGLLVILRLWRLIKLSGGVAVGIGEMDEEAVKKLVEAEEKIRRLEAELHRSRQIIDRLDDSLQAQSGSK